MEEIELRVLLARLFRRPGSLAQDVTDVVAANLAEHWWRLVVVVGVFLLLRHALGRMRDPADLTAVLRSDTRASSRLRAQRSMLASVGSFVLWVVFVVALAAQLGIVVSAETFGWILGSLSLTAAFALRAHIADALSGWTALAEDRYGIGDYVDLGFGVAGTVVGIGLWTTRLRGADGTLYHVRNTEMDKVGNRTQSQARLLVDVELTRADEQFVTSGELEVWERLVLDSLTDLRSTLQDVRSVARAVPAEGIDVTGVASVVPAIVPRLTVEQMDRLRQVDPDDSGVLPVVVTVIRQAPAGGTPLFRDIEMLGLVTSTPSSVTVRVRVQLADPRSRSYAVALLRRTLFDTMNGHRVAVGFTDVPEGGFIN